MVLWVDEKSQIRTLSRFEPVLHLMPGTLKAAATTMSVTAPPLSLQLWTWASGKVIESLRQRHRAAEFTKLLIQIDGEVPKPGSTEIHQPIARNSNIGRWARRSSCRCDAVGHLGVTNQR
jgi:hypothetical protein